MIVLVGLRGVLSLELLYKNLSKRFRKQRYSKVNYYAWVKNYA